MTREFVQWLEGVEPGALQGVHYAVFGCGDRNWASTYQDVPRLTDEQLALKGARRLSLRGEADASRDFEKQLDEWRDRMWSDALNAFGLQVNGVGKERSTLNVQFASGLAGAPLALAYDAAYGTVTANRELQLENSDRSTRLTSVNWKLCWRRASIRMRYWRNASRCWSCLKNMKLARYRSQGFWSCCLL